MLRSGHLFAFFSTLLLAGLSARPAYSQERLSRPEFCDGFSKAEVEVDGQKIMRYTFSELKYLQCTDTEQPAAPWIVKKNKWEDSDEVEWQNFIKNFGLAVEKGKCKTLDSCMISQANVYRNEVDLRAHYYSDCGRFPMFLRAYFAYKKNLPFSFVYRVEPRELTLEQMEKAQKLRDKYTNEGPEQLQKFEATEQDIRYTRNGNRPIERVNIPHRRGSVQRDFFQMAAAILDGVSSASYRILQADNLVGNETQPDFYSPKIDTESIKIGTVLYTADGHVALIYDIRPNGDLRTVNAAPGNELTTKAFSNGESTEFTRSTPSHGAGFKNWRPFELTEPMLGVGKATGEIVGGPIVHKKDAEITDFSLEQYYGNRPDPNGVWDQGKFEYNGLPVSWTRFVQLRLSGGVFKQNPVFEFRRDLTGLCSALQDRAAYVTSAMGPTPLGPVFQQAHPSKLPDNIYGASGDWESFSSPGKDLRLRNQALQVIRNLQDYKNKLISHDPYFDYRGKNLKFDLLKVFFEVDQGCQVAYVNSQGKAVVIASLSLALERLPRVSFDPYNCPELRWGAKRRQELTSCTDDEEKHQWYVYTEFLRNARERNPKDIMGWDLDFLKTQSGAGNRAADSTEFSVLKALEAL